MAAFATPEELESRWRKLDEGERKRAETLLGDASAMLAAEMGRCGVEIDETDEVQASLLCLVCCSMVRRAMASEEFADVKSKSITAGPYSGQVTFANPTGNMYVTADERRLLGIPKRRVRIGSIAPRSRWSK